MENNHMKRVQYHSSLEKYKLKPQCDPQTLLEQYLRVKRLSLRVAKDGYQMKLSYCAVLNN